MSSSLEREFAIQVKAVGLPVPKAEYRFHSIRKFRFDFAWPEQKIAVEIDGGTFSGGRHTRGIGYRNDCIKYNLASCSGWVVLRGDRQMVRDGSLLASLEQIIKSRG